MAERYPETSLSSLGEIGHVPVCVPHYATCHTPIVATGEVGSDAGELYSPFGVAIHEDTHQIFIVNGNDRVEIFSDTGDFLYQLGVGQLDEPYGIAIHGDSVYVSCEDDNISKLSLSSMCRIRRIGGRGSNNGQFYNISQLTTDPIGRVFIADTDNDRICIHDPDLNHLRNIMHESMSQPEDVNILRDRLYVLCPNESPCVYVFTLEEDKLHSFVACGEEMDVLFPLFFCLDPLNNFVISDKDTHSIRVFSQEGNLLHTIGREGHRKGMFQKPQGVVITPNGRLVCVSENENYGLQIFY